jgi:hypothetical protein
LGDRPRADVVGKAEDAASKGDIPMTKTAIFKKVGRRYREIGEYDDESQYLPLGATLVVKGKGGESRRFHVEPDFASVEVALKACSDAMVAAMQAAATFKPARERLLTPRERKAWEAYREIVGPETSSLYLVSESAHGIVDAAIAVAREHLKKRKDP